VKDVDGFCSRTFGCEVQAKRALETIEHGFTHFRLSIRPLLCKVVRTPGLETPGRLWIGLADAAQAAVPTPVRTLVARLAA
jgi:A/G-specific adenine glycosylase